MLQNEKKARFFLWTSQHSVADKRFFAAKRAPTHWLESWVCFSESKPRICWFKKLRHHGNTEFSFWVVSVVCIVCNQFQKITAFLLGLLVLLSLGQLHFPVHNPACCTFILGNERNMEGLERNMNGNETKLKEMKGTWIRKKERKWKKMNSTSTFSRLFLQHHIKNRHFRRVFLDFHYMMRRLRRNLRLVTTLLCAALTIWFAKKTQHEAARHFKDDVAGVACWMPSNFGIILHVCLLKEVVRQSLRNQLVVPRIATPLHAVAFLSSWIQMRHVCRVTSKDSCVWTFFLVCIWGFNVVSTKPLGGKQKVLFSFWLGSFSQKSCWKKMATSKVKHPANIGKRLQHVSTTKFRSRRLTLTLAEPPDLSISFNYLYFSVICAFKRGK